MKKLSAALLALCAGVAMNATAADKYIQLGSVSPMPNTMISQFNYTTIVLQEPMDVASVEQLAEITYTVTDYGVQSDVHQGLPMTVTKTKGGDLRVAFSDAVANELKEAGKWPVADAGVYTLTIPEGALKVVSEAGVEYTNETITLSWDLIPPLKYEVLPDPSKSVPELSGDVVMTFPIFPNILMTDAFKVTVKGPEGEIPMTGNCSVLENRLVIPMPGTLGVPGEYTVTLAAGSIDLFGSEVQSQQVNPEISVKFDVAGVSKPEVISISPEQGAVEALSGVTLIYNMDPSSNPDCKETLKVFFNDEMKLEFASKSNNVQFAIDNEDPKTVNFVFVKSLADIYREPGKYRVEIPAGFMRFRSGEDFLYSEPLTLNYEIAERFDYSIDPMGGTVENIKVVTLTFKDAVKIEAMPLEKDEEGGGIIQMYTLAGSSVENLIPTLEIQGDKVIMTFPDAPAGVRRVGKFTLDVPYGAFTITKANGFSGLSQSICVNYNIPTFPLPEVDPAPGDIKAEDLDEITFTLTDGLTYGTWFAGMKARLYKEKADGSLGEAVGYWDRKGQTVSVNGATSVSIFPDAEYVIPSGQYILKITQHTFSVVVPEGSPYEGGYLLNDLMYRYNIEGDDTAVDTLDEAADAPAPVYAVDGTVVVRQASADDLRNLPAGIYIFRGRKIAVR